MGDREVPFSQCCLLLWSLQVDRKLFPSGLREPTVCHEQHCLKPFDIYLDCSISLSTQSRVLVSGWGCVCHGCHSWSYLCSAVWNWSMVFSAVDGLKFSTRILKGSRLWSLGKPCPHPTPRVLWDSLPPLLLHRKVLLSKTKAKFKGGVCCGL